MIYDTPEKLEKHLKFLKKLWLKRGIDRFNLYPNFCLLLQKDADKYALPKETILNMSLDIFHDVDKTDF